MRLVLFDCDGTLVDSEALIVAAMRTAFASQGLTPPEDGAVRRIIGLSLEAAAFELLAPHGRSAEGAAAVARAYREAHRTLTDADADGEPLFAGIRELLRELADERTLFGIVTGKSRRGLTRVLERHALSETFAVTRTADDCPSKPSPVMVLEAMADAGAATGETVVVGDTTFDIEMARAAGVRSIAVTWGAHPADALVDAGADALAETPQAVAGLIDASLSIDGAPFQRARQR